MNAKKTVDSKDTCEFCDFEDFKAQLVYENEKFHILLPRKPLSSSHVMIVAAEHFQRFDQMDEETSRTFVSTVKRLHGLFSNVSDYLGYNMTSNNGDYSIGQHVPHFHVHMYLRFSSEDHSPFDVLSGKTARHDYTDEEYAVLISHLRNELNV